MILIEKAFFYVVLFVLVIGVLIPALRGTPMFGFIRRKTPLDDRIEAARRRKAEAQKSLELAALEHDALEMEQRAAEPEREVAGTADAPVDNETKVEGSTDGTND